MGGEDHRTPPAWPAWAAWLRLNQAVLVFLGLALSPRTKLGA